MLSMRDLNPRVKDKILTKFAMAVPNAEKMVVDHGRDKLDVYYDGIHYQTFSIKQVLEKALIQINKALTNSIG